METIKILKTDYKIKNYNQCMGQNPKIIDSIIIHHSAFIQTTDLQTACQHIEQSHLNRGYSAIGYHFLIGKNGDIAYGRPINYIGAHCKTFNTHSIGICLIGNFEDETPTNEQYQSLVLLINHLRKYFINPYAKIYLHKNLNATLCPGKNFSVDKLNKILNREDKKMLESANDIIWELSQRYKISNVNKAVTDLEKAKKEDSSCYWLLKKIANGEEK